jgi:hypothetical protein
MVGGRRHLWPPSARCNGRKKERRGERPISRVLRPRIRYGPNARRLRKRIERERPNAQLPQPQRKRDCSLWAHSIFSAYPIYVISLLAVEQSVKNIARPVGDLRCVPKPSSARR